MDENLFAEHSANSKWTKTFSRRTLQIQNGRKLFRGALCKFKMDENFFAEHSANPKWTKTFSRSTLQIQNGRNTAKMAAHRFTPYRDSGMQNAIDLDAGGKSSEGLAVDLPARVRGGGFQYEE
jgi:hypothetical protein